MSSSPGGVMEGRVQTGPPLLYRIPHVLLTASEVEEAVREVSRSDMFVIDIETDSELSQSNALMWVGLGVAGQNFLIPCGHPKGAVLEREHIEKRSVHDLYPPGHAKTLTPGGKLRNAHENVKVPTTYHPPPKQLYPDELCHILRPLLFSDRAKLGHNVKFDILSLAKYFGGEIPPGPYHDTIILRHVINENLSDYSLKELTFAWFEIAKADRKTFYPNLGKSGIGNFGLDEVARYLAKDLRYCWYQHKHWMPRLIARGLLPVYEFEMSVYPVIMDIEHQGFPVDLSAMDRVRAELEKNLADISQGCFEQVGGQFSMSDLGAKRWILFGEGTPAFPIDLETGRTLKAKPLESQNLKVLGRTPKEKLPQVTQAVLEVYEDRGNPLASLLLQWSAYEKLRGTFVEGFTKLLNTHGDELPTLHTSYKQHSTVTGRLSSTKPNLQQLPRGTVIRDLFVAGPGNVLIVADYDQIELRCLALLAAERTMIAIFKEGRDIHREAAAAAMRVAIETVTAVQRDVGKTLNFATGYGAGAERIAFVARTTKRRGQQFLDRYYATFSGLEPWKTRVLAAAKKTGDKRKPTITPPYVVIPPIGRLRRLPDLHRFQQEERYLRLRAERQAINAVVQGFASNIAKLAMIDLHTKLQPYPAHMLAQVHDEIVIQVEESYLDTVMPIVTETMTGVVGPDGQPILGQQIPLIVSAKAGYTWASAKGK